MGVSMNKDSYLPSNFRRMAFLMEELIFGKLKGRLVTIYLQDLITRMNLENSNINKIMEVEELEKKLSHHVA